MVGSDEAESVLRRQNGIMMRFLVEIQAATSATSSARTPSPTIPVNHALVCRPVGVGRRANTTDAVPSNKEMRPHKDGRLHKTVGATQSSGPALEGDLVRNATNNAAGAVTGRYKSAATAKTKLPIPVLSPGGCFGGTRTYPIADSALSGFDDAGERKEVWFMPSTLWTPMPHRQR